MKSRPYVVLAPVLYLPSALAAGLEALSETQETKLADLLSQMTQEEKVGQLNQRNAPGGLPDTLRAELEAGQIGSILNEVDPQTVNAIQRVAVEDSRLGIPLMMARDVIHGYRTIFPIPLGLAATFDPELIREGARIAAVEAASQGVNWTFAPMIDVTRDPRWGRVAESFGEDWYLTAVMGRAMVEGFQGDSLSDFSSIAATAKHFAGYGASEAGRDYNTTNIPEHELRNVYLRPFRATADAGVATFMTSFSDLNGIPASGNDFLLRQILRQEWGFDGFVVSDWASIEQLVDHGLAVDGKDAARQALVAGVNMEMVTTTYADYASDLINSGAVPQAVIDNLVAEILRVKMALGLFDDPYTDTDAYPALGNEKHLAAARKSALQSLVLLHNDGALPIAAGRTVAVIGPLADAPHEQMGTWVFDGREDMTITPKAALTESFSGSGTLLFEQALATSRAAPTDGFKAAIQAANKADVVILFLGEESILSGEAHSRADIGLPGSQDALLEAMDATGKPIVTVIMAGRPLTLDKVLGHSDAVLYAWHPGTMGGPAIADVLLGRESPSGRLPITFPRMVGQVPIYYAQKNTGKPATPETFTPLEDLPVKAFQAAYGMTSHHLDAGYTPLYPFGFGLTYSEFAYSDLEISSAELTADSPIQISARIRNTGSATATETVQLYVRDLVGSVTRPIRELKGFERVTLQPGESQRVKFELAVDDLDFYDRRMQRVTEAGEFHVWIAPDSASGLHGEFTIPSDYQARQAP